MAIKGQGMPPKSKVLSALDKTTNADGTWNKTAAAELIGVHRDSVRKFITTEKIVEPTATNATISLEQQQEKAKEKAEQKVQSLVDSEKIRLTEENKRLKKQLRELLHQQVRQADLELIVTELGSTNTAPPKWTSPKKKSNKERAIVSTILSDMHYDEVVRPEEVDYVNAYDREIAELRTKRFFKNVIRLGTEYINGIEVEGLVLNLLGDCVSGNIHDELRRTNAATIVQTCIHWPEQMCAGIEQLLEVYPKIYVPCVVGNHGRYDRKPLSKFRAQENYDFLIYHMIARHFRQEVKEGVISFAISEAADYRYPIYNTRYQISHGDQFRGGTGIAGLYSPLMLGHHRKSRREASKKKPYDHLLMGHWHTQRDMHYILVNGSLKGYDEYAETSNFDLEPPQQLFWLTDPEHGKTVVAPVHVLDPNEPWRKDMKKGLDPVF